MNIPRRYREIRRYLPLVNVVIEVADSRAPSASRHHLVMGLIDGKRHILALNKSDLAREDALEDWIRAYRERGIDAVAISTRTGSGIADLRLRLVETGMARKTAQHTHTRLMVLGIPNVGKSSLLNALAHRKKARTGAKPGITKGPQWINIDPFTQAVDFPGVLWPHLTEESRIARLAAIRAIPDTSYEPVSVSLWIIRRLWPHNRPYFEEIFGPDISFPGISSPDDPEALGCNEERFMEILRGVAVSRGCLKRGGELDLTRAAGILIDEYSRGRLGPSMLDDPPSSALSHLPSGSGPH